jgi:hypothetical protein
LVAETLARYRPLFRREPGFTGLGPNCNATLRRGGVAGAAAPSAVSPLVSGGFGAFGGCSMLYLSDWRRPIPLPPRRSAEPRAKTMLNIYSGDALNIRQKSLDCRDGFAAFVGLTWNLIGNPPDIFLART